MPHTYVSATGPTGTVYICPMCRWTDTLPRPPSADMRRTFVVQQLAALAPLPCRVDAMTAREYAIYHALIPAVAALQTLAGWCDAAPAVEKDDA